jgi:hypothetical protein
MTIDSDRLFDKIKELVSYHSPSGVEAEIDRALLEQFTTLGLACRREAPRLYPIGSAWDESPVN